MENLSLESLKTLIEKTKQNLTPGKNWDSSRNAKLDTNNIKLYKHTQFIKNGDGTPSQIFYQIGTPYKFQQHDVDYLTTGYRGLTFCYRNRKNEVNVKMDSIVESFCLAYVKTTEISETDFVEAINNLYNKIS